MISKVVRVTLKKIFFLIYFYLWLCWVFVAAHGLNSLTICVILIPQPGIKPTSPAFKLDS